MSSYDETLHLSVVVVVVTRSLPSLPPFGHLGQQLALSSTSPLKQTMQLLISGTSTTNQHLSDSKRPIATIGIDICISFYIEVYFNVCILGLCAAFLRLDLCLNL
ncbi:hypothetical protein C8F01DRAFT_1242962 [Mycena amicta]|nr:hypothetical protein C8F01DRAFT_1242962 [Mycena amicta]